MYVLQSSTFDCVPSALRIGYISTTTAGCWMKWALRNSRVEAEIRRGFHPRKMWRDDCPFPSFPFICGGTGQNGRPPHHELVDVSELSIKIAAVRRQFRSTPACVAAVVHARGFLSAAVSAHKAEEVNKKRTRRRQIRISRLKMMNTPGRNKLLLERSAAAS